MSMELSGALQGAIYTALSGDATLSALVGSEIYDAPIPAGSALPAGPFVTFGEEVVKPFDTVTSRGGRHEFAVSVHSQASGFAEAKAVAAAIGNILVDAALPLSGGHLVALRFVKAQAKRGVAPELRRIDMRFLAVVENI